MATTLTTMKSNFEKVCTWYNSLENNKQVAILGYLKNRTVDDSLTKEDLLYLNKLVVLLPKVFTEMKNEEQILSFFSECGLEQIVSKSMLDFAKKVETPFRDAKVLKSLSTKNLKNVVNFVIEKIYIYEDFLVTPLEEYLEICGISDEEEARSALRFIKNQINSVLRKRYSPKVLESILKSDYEFEEEQVKIIIELIRENLQTMEQSYSIRQLNSILSKLSELSASKDSSTS